MMFEELINQSNDFEMPSSYFCASPEINKTQYVSIWKKLKKEQKFSLGKVFSTKIEDIIRRLQSQKVFITVSKTEIPNQIVIFL